MNNHEYYLERTLELAKLGWGKTNPNPLVGAVIVKDGQIIAEGYHRQIGEDHAEVDAFNRAREDVRGGTLYVNLEPCSHFGRTPPCTKKIIESGICRVVVAMEDPNPKVSGAGIRLLREAGIEVVVGIIDEKARKLNEIFIKYITRKNPFVLLKTAMTLDGKIASVSGDSRWISGESSRQQVHLLRNRFAAIMVGSNTVISDNPALTTRLRTGDGRDPIRIIIDSKGLIPLESNVINSESAAQVILATTSAIEPKKESQLIAKGVQILKLDSPDGHVDLVELLNQLYRQEIDSILLEGGGGLNAAFLKLGLVDKVMVFIAPKIIGGENAKTPVAGSGIQLMKNALQLNNINVSRLDDDLVVEGYLKGEPCLLE